MASHSPSKPSPAWQLEDLIDFDYAIETETKAGTLTSHKHREVFLDFTAAQKSSAPAEAKVDRSSGFRFWLEAQRKKEPLSKLLPGRLFCRGLHSLKILLFVFAILSGTLITATLLRYDGSQPTNVAGFLTLLLGGQVLLLSLTALAFALRRFGTLKQESGVLVPLVISGLNHVLDWIQKRTESHTSAELKLQLRAFLGTAAKKQSQYRSIILGIIATLIQAFGIWFNVAALATTLFLVTVSDRAFGWQSSLSVTPEQTYKLTRLIGLPWSFIIPSGVPTQAEIEGSRIYLKDGIKRLTNENLVSWWPFLVCSLVTYGFLPRFVLWYLSHAFVRGRFRSLQFDSLSCDRLWESMTTQELRTSGRILQTEESPPPPLRDVRPEAPSAPVIEPEPEEQTAILIVDPELAKRLVRENTDSAIQQHIGWKVERWIRLPDETQSTADFWNTMEPLRSESAFERLILIQEAFQPPIRESIEWLQQLRATQPSKGKMMIYLVGRPEEAGKRRDVCETNERVWSQTIDSLTDDNLGVTPLEISNATE